MQRLLIIALAGLVVLSFTACKGVGKAVQKAGEVASHAHPPAPRPPSSAPIPVPVGAAGTTLNRLVPTPTRTPLSAPR